MNASTVALIKTGMGVALVALGAILSAKTHIDPQSLGALYGVGGTLIPTGLYQAGQASQVTTTPPTNPVP